MQPQQRAHLCFSYISLYFIAIALLQLLATPSPLLQTIIMIIGIPATIVFVLSSLIGIMSTFIFCRDQWPLVAMSASLFGLYLLFFSNKQQLSNPDADNSDLYRLAFLAAALIVILSARWFLEKNRANIKQP
ncbi:MAG: hypothetical protein Q9N68_00730 [Gammaproteobacteria bacterium]|nr:hypothetical protein [Gammaproteobacteria bacterium]